MGQRTPAPADRPGTVDLPPPLEDLLFNQLGQKRDAFVAALNAPSPISIRLNPAKAFAAELEPVPWCSTGRFLGDICRRRGSRQDRGLPVHLDLRPIEPGQLQCVLRPGLELRFQPCGAMGGLVHAPPRDKGQREERNETRQVVKQAHDVADLL